MTKEQLIARLGYFLDPDNGIGAVLYFVIKHEKETLIRFADIEDDAKNELKDRFLEYIAEKFIDNEELHFLNISEGDDRKNVVYHYDIDERPSSLNILEEIFNNEEQDHFQFNEHDLKEIDGYLISIGNETNRIVLYKKQYPVNLLRQDRFLLIPMNERLVKVGNDALALDKSFDFMRVDDNLIVLKLETLERFFGFEEVIRNQANNTIAMVETNHFLEDIGQLTVIAQSMTNAKKLMRMRNSPVLNVPVNSLIAFIKNHSELTGRIAFNDSETRVNLTTAVSKRLFLKLLNDDYLFSQLTELQYDSQAKDKLDNNQQEPWG